MRRLVLCIVLLASFAGAASAGTSVTVSVKSKQKLFAATVTHPDPLPVEQLHVWTVRLFDRKHRAVTGARIKVTGDMPAHGHGLPTAPVAVSRGRGVYQLQGMMFQMPGLWYVQLRVRAGNRLDTIRVKFTIPE
jgi:YtkA-like protein